MNPARNFLRHARRAHLRERQPSPVKLAGTAPAAPETTALATALADTNIAVIGTVGIPATYGGFETLVENLARFHKSAKLSSRLVVYCSALNYAERPHTHLGVELRYIPLSANGRSSVLYDALSLLSAIRRGADVCLLLGVSGAIVLPLVRFVSKTRIVTNIDGIEWKREKWSGFSKWFLRMSERTAVRFSHEVIADNEAIARHVKASYGRDCRVIAYGGDHALLAPPAPYEGQALPARYALSLCRIEPENNVAMILDAFAGMPDQPLVFIGNWSHSRFGRELKQRYGSVAHLHLLDPIYDVGVLRTIRSSAALYVHGHSAGGTNPSLVEMMHFGLPIIAYDCSFNRFTTDDAALFFDSASSLRSELGKLRPQMAKVVGGQLKRIAELRYTWEAVSRDYFRLLGRPQEPLRTAVVPAGTEPRPQKS
jgi:glycosyltransferase involved in cell wall biosynthesis